MIRPAYDVPSRRWHCLFRISSGKVCHQDCGGWHGQLACTAAGQVNCLCSGVRDVQHPTCDMHSLRLLGLCSAPAGKTNEWVGQGAVGRTRACFVGQPELWALLAGAGTAVLHACLQGCYGGGRQHCLCNRCSAACGTYYFWGWDRQGQGHAHGS